MAIERVYVHPVIRGVFRTIPFFGPLLSVVILFAPGLAFRLGPFLVLPFFDLSVGVIVYSLAKITYLIVKKERQAILRYGIYAGMNVPYILLLLFDPRIRFLMSQGLI